MILQASVSTALQYAMKETGFSLVEEFYRDLV